MDQMSSRGSFWSKPLCDSTHYHSVTAVSKRYQTKKKASQAAKFPTSMLHVPGHLNKNCM